MALLIALLATCLSVPAKGATPAGPLRQDLPGSFRWSSTGPVISPQQDDSNSVAVKDPSVVQDKNGRWHVFMTTASTSGDWSLAHTSFCDWSQAASAKQTHLETASRIGPVYVPLRTPSTSPPRTRGTSSTRPACRRTPPPRTSTTRPAGPRRRTP
ncbi:non-reducing end alpha-L-arabinofuranosidase family hydrolase [Streptomyces sp. NPDC055400]